MRPIIFRKVCNVYLFFVQFVKNLKSRNDVLFTLEYKNTQEFSFILK